MNNICQGRIKLGDVLKENMTGQIMLAVASVFKGESLSEPTIDLMLFKYDEEKNIVFWKDDSGNCFDLDNLRKEDLTYPIHSRLDQITEMYLFELDHTVTTENSKDPFNSCHMPI